MVRGKFDAAFRFCEHCQFIQAENPIWLEEAYSDPINRSDVGYLARNVHFSRISPLLIWLLRLGSGPYLDYGGGYGVFVRLMRDQGFDFRLYDRHCPNLFAQGFEASTTGTARYSLLTAFEVFEHLVEPLPAIDQMLALAPAIFFSTELSPERAPQPAEWNYYGLDHGQHVSLYSLKTLQVLAARYGVHLASNGRNLHLLSRSWISIFAFKLATKRKVAMLFRPFWKRASLAPPDQERAIAETVSRAQFR
jgi:hypothetical protein